ncbi:MULTISPECIES: DUF2147 domain-containing protein [unclassified Sphingopyxis]|uniref:DUF2147 domain-containing protein n=1 Tax=unclassified Sphingopyxis TaxID=2614943 RepID=UPI0007379A12|nr:MULTISPECIES: DUF2147 domain-containing protein [unclassified Sphingopyxis]KTE43592.1 hypothetical protein ATE62_03920 [Sphingopyxis sp. HIX]KTE85301.1 hypothetical protein ATE72_04505 [Sphingopyxis sp. HXXIV]
MKRILVSLAAVALAVPAGASATDIMGVWATGSEGGRVEIYRCGKALCGKIVDAKRLRANPDLRDVRNSDPKLRQRKLKGLVVLQGFSGGPREWKGGPVYDPESGDGAGRGQLKLLANGTLELKGCVAVFCRTKIWTRPASRSVD